VTIGREGALQSDLASPHSAFQRVGARWRPTRPAALPSPFLRGPGVGLSRAIRAGHLSPALGNSALPPLARSDHEVYDQIVRQNRLAPRGRKASRARLGPGRARSGRLDHGRKQGRRLRDREAVRRTWPGHSDKLSSRRGFGECRRRGASRARGTPPCDPARCRLQAHGS
jgi:hypothetical protein